MEPIVVGYLGIGVLILLLFTGMHIGAVMGIIGFAGIVYLLGWGPGLGILQTVPYNTWANYNFSVIPLFVLMGEFCFRSKISTDLYTAAYKFLGGLRGGLAMATVGACAAFAAVSGSSIATAATMGTVALPEMKKRNYDMSLATGSVAAGGTLGILIPPSVILVVYGMLTMQSIGTLFLAGFVPGVLQAILFILLIAFICWRNPSLGPGAERFGWKEKFLSLRSAWIVVLLFVIVIGGIYAGWFSPTEGAGVGAAVAFIFALARRTMGWKGFRAALLETARTSGMIFFIMCGAMILGYFFAITRLPHEFATMVSGFELNPYVIWILIIILYLVLGCLMDTMAMVLLTVPIIFPLMCGPAGLGFDPIWFGIMVVIVAETGMITPPVGMNLFVIKGMAPEVPTIQIYKGILPYVVMNIFILFLYTLVPGIILFLPALLG
ncbi:MAG TPA: TRAP transporter large permease [Dehalococcoidales bacterium]|nr:TRAP transporter large permease [Dehalococcoidales bacterium]